MNKSKQVLLGTAVLLGGVGLLYGTISQVLTSDEYQTQTPEKNDKIITKTEEQQPLPTHGTAIASTISDNSLQTASVPVIASVPVETISTTHEKNNEQITPNNVNNHDIEPSSNTETDDVIDDNSIIQPTTTIANAPVTHTSNSQTTKSVAQKNNQLQPIIEESSIEYHQITQPVTTVRQQSTTTTIQPKIAQKTQPKSVAPATETTVKKTTTTTQPKMAKTDNQPNQYQVKSGEGLIVLARRFDVPIDVLAQANQIDKNKALNVGQNLKIPTANEIQKIQQQNEEQQRYQEAVAKLKQARKLAKENKEKDVFGVQVSLAVDETSAKEVAKQLTKAEYKVKLFPANRGVKVVVGPEIGKEPALALKDVINTDPRIPVDNAWVLDWEK